MPGLSRDRGFQPDPKVIMSICTDEDVVKYFGAGGRPFPPALAPLITTVRNSAENLIKDFVGYNVEFAQYTEYHPAKKLNQRFDGDETSQGFDLIGGTVLPRATFPTARRELVLFQLPVRSIVSIYDNPAAYNLSPPSWPASSLLPANAYFIDSDYVDEITGYAMCMSGIIYRNVGSWGVFPRTVKITYNAGFTADELATRYTMFAEAVKQTCAYAFLSQVAHSKAVGQGGLMSAVSIEDFSVTFAKMSEGVIGSLLGNGVTCASIPATACQLLRDYRNVARDF